MTFRSICLVIRGFFCIFVEIENIKLLSQKEDVVIVQPKTAQIAQPKTRQMPKILELTSLTNHIEILCP